jgi:putative Mg2+ transporter-C (MgtC) family protein
VTHIRPHNDRVASSLDLPVGLSELLPGWVWSDLANLCLASVLGAVIGIERRLKAQAAGMRTQMLIAAGSCIAMEVSRYAPLHEQVGDPGRIAQSILAGIGFLGAGAIVKVGVTIQGLTTAGAIWCSAAIGLAAGSGLAVHAIGLGVLTLLALWAFDPLESRLTRHRDLRRIIVTATSELSLVDRIRDLLPELGLGLENVGVKQNVETGRLTVTVTANFPEDLSPRKLVSELRQLPGVVEVELEGWNL